MLCTLMYIIYPVLHTYTFRNYRQALLDFHPWHPRFLVTRLLSPSQHGGACRWRSRYQPSSCRVDMSWVQGTSRKIMVVEWNVWNFVMLGRCCFSLKTVFLVLKSFEISLVKCLRRWHVSQKTWDQRWMREILDLNLTLKHCGYSSLPSLKLTAKAPENRPVSTQKERRKYSNHPFSGAFAASLVEVTPQKCLIPCDRSWNNPSLSSLISQLQKMQQRIVKQLKWRRLLLSSIQVLSHRIVVEIWGDKKNQQYI